MTKQNKKGFTIIEVVLVLAIGGLIFLMVFIALPALQRSQRNTQREDDLSRVLTAVNDYQTNNSGKTPFEDGGVNARFIERYVDPGGTTWNVNAESGEEVTACGDQFKDPDGECYQIINEGAAQPGDQNKDVTFELDFDHTFHVYTNAGCGTNEGTFNAGTGKRQVAIFFVEEGGAIACNDNH